MPFKICNPFTILKSHNSSSYWKFQQEKKSFWPTTIIIISLYHSDWNWDRQKYSQLERYTRMNGKRVFFWRLKDVMRLMRWVCKQVAKLDLYLVSGSYETYSCNIFAYFFGSIIFMMKGIGCMVHPAEGTMAPIDSLLQMLSLTNQDMPLSIFRRFGRFFYRPRRFKLNISLKNQAHKNFVTKFSKNWVSSCSFNRKCNKNYEKENVDEKKSIKEIFNQKSFSNKNRSHH